MSADTQTHTRRLTHTHSHTNKPYTAGVQLVGHTSINVRVLVLSDSILLCHSTQPPIIISTFFSFTSSRAFCPFLSPMSMPHITELVWTPICTFPFSFTLASSCRTTLMHIFQFIHAAIISEFHSSVEIIAWSFRLPASIPSSTILGYTDFTIDAM